MRNFADKLHKQKGGGFRLGLNLSKPNAQKAHDNSRIENEKLSAEAATKDELLGKERQPRVLVRRH